MLTKINNTSEKWLLHLFLLATLYFLVLGLESLVQELSKQVLISIISVVFTALLVEMAFLVILRRWCGQNIGFIALISLLLAINSITLYFSFFQSAIAQTPLALTISFAGYSLAVFILVFLSFHIKPVRDVLLFILIAGIIVGTAQRFTQLYKNTVSNPKATSELSNFAQRYDKINLDQKPNIHLVSFDSMLPPTLAMKHMNIPELAYDTFLRNEGAVIFKNAFISQAPTAAALTSVSLLATPGFDYKKNAFSLLFNGSIQEPLFHLFRNNGYKIAIGKNPANHKIGKGPYVDEYNDFETHTAQQQHFLSQSILCKTQNTFESTVQLFGVCRYGPVILEPEINMDQNSWPNFVFNLIEEKAADDQPWLTFHYIYYTIGHTDKSYVSKSKKDLAEYSKFFDQQQQNLGKNVLPELIETIKKKDPNSIVLIFGDHGPWLSRTLKFKKNPEFVVHDRHGIYIALLNTTHSCSTRKNAEKYAASYITPERIILGLIRCLSSNQDEVDRVGVFQEAYPFEQYLYDSE